MEIRIGIVQSMKDIELELGEEQTLEGVQALVNQALAGDAVLWLTDKKGRTVGVPAGRISYVEFAKSQERIVGFGA
jgi:hypothetical protein